MFRLLFLFLGVGIASASVTRGVNFFGFETEARAPEMLWCQPLQWQIDTVADLGFNTIRLPVSEDFIMANWTSQYPQEGVINPNFPEAGMKSIYIMDELFRLAAARNISIIMDIHRLYDTSQSPKPFIDNTIYTFVRFMSAWIKILRRYHVYPNFIGIDVFNEFSDGSGWPVWKNLAEIAINHVESIFPGRFLYFAEGVNWGGDLRGALDAPMALPPDVMRRFQYSVHKYWFSDQGLYNNWNGGGWDETALRQSWEYSFGFLNEKVMVGEWGYISEDPKQAAWAALFVKYLRDKNILDTFFWSFSWNSGDTHGIVKEDCTSINTDKMDLLHRLWS